MAPVAVFRHFAKFLKICPITFGMELPNDGTNEPSKDGFDGIALKVIFQIVPFSDCTIFTYVSILFSSTEVLPNYCAM